MDKSSKWELTEKEKDNFISLLTPNLSILRVRADISQDELANLIGISRQTYGSIERKTRKMSWSTYLSLIIFFDHNEKTHRLLRQLALFPKDLVIRFNEGTDFSDFEWSAVFGEKSQDIASVLDAEAIEKIHNVVVQEYSRCAKLPEGAVVKAFNGFTTFIDDDSKRDIEAMKAIRAIIKRTDKK